MESDEIIIKMTYKLSPSYLRIKGFSTANLWRMKNFYFNYKESEKLAPMMREIRFQQYKENEAFLPNISKMGDSVSQIVVRKEK